MVEYRDFKCLPIVPGVAENELALICAAAAAQLWGWDGVIRAGVLLDGWWSTVSADLLAVGKEARFVVIASCKRHFTSSAVDKSKGVWPSWFFNVGSAPWASNNEHNCVLPFWAASCRGVKPHLSVAVNGKMFVYRKMLRFDHKNISCS